MYDSPDEERKCIIKARSLLLAGTLIMWASLSSRLLNEESSIPANSFHVSLPRDRTRESRASRPMTLRERFTKSRYRGPWYMVLERIRCPSWRCNGGRCYPSSTVYSRDGGGRDMVVSWAYVCASVETTDHQPGILERWTGCTGYSRGNIHRHDLQNSSRFKVQRFSILFLTCMRRKIGRNRRVFNVLIVKVFFLD